MSVVCWAARCLAAWLLVLGLVGRPGESPAQDRTARPDLAAADWGTNLARGPNGPIPAIVVDQFGYLPKSRKVAVVRVPQTGYDASAAFKPSKSYGLIEVPSGKVVVTSALTVWNSGSTDQASGDKTWWFDFSEVEAPGRYAVVDFENGVRSPSFTIDEHVYRDAMKHALRAFYYQRAGFEKTPEFAGPNWADKASHLGPGQDAESRPWGAARLTPLAKSLIKDLRGGWYDAGDYNKYTSWAARYIIVLLHAYAEHPQAFGDDYEIPESGNGIPDILDEVKWGLDWLIRMQNLDGSLLCVQGLDSASPPSSARGASSYGPPTTSATLMGAAAFAYASKIFASRAEPDLKEYGEKLRQRGLSAWKWTTSNPEVVYYNNDDSKQPGSKGLAAGQQEMSSTDRLRAQFEAATFLFEVTGDEQYKEFAERNYGMLLPPWGASMWEVDALDSLLYYAQLPGVTVAVANSIRKNFLTNLAGASKAFQSSLQQADPYRAPIKDYTWGSNKGKAMQARLFQLSALYSSDPATVDASLAAALEYTHYLHGVNPLGLVYLTNMAITGASHSAATMFHAWFAYGTRWERVVDKQRPGPPPGFLVGGPNPQFSMDSCCRVPAGSPAYRCYGAATFSLCQRSYTPPLAQPAAKSYLQFNDPWPANSWAISEPSLQYQSYYVRLLAAFVRKLPRP
jgi:endoglucanase